MTGDTDSCRHPDDEMDEEDGAGAACEDEAKDEDNEEEDLGDLNDMRCDLHLLADEDSERDDVEDAEARDAGTGMKSAAEGRAGDGSGAPMKLTLVKLTLVAAEGVSEDMDAGSCGAIASEEENEKDATGAGGAVIAVEDVSGETHTPDDEEDEGV